MKLLAMKLYELKEIVKLNLLGWTKILRQTTE